MTDEYGYPYEEVENDNEMHHNSAPDRFLLCSGGMDSTAMAHFMQETVWDDGWSAWNKRPVVVFLDTTIGLSSQRLYVQMLGRHYGWQVWCLQTHQDYEEHTEDEGFYGPQQHGKIFNVLKARQVSKAATVSGNPHFYFGSRVDEKGDHVKRKGWDDGVGAHTHNPIYQWSDEDVVSYLRENDVPFNPNWEGAHPTDCACGATAAREELIELEAEGYEVFAQKLRDLEERVETDDRRGFWAWGSFDDEGRDMLDEAAEDGLSSLMCGPNCSGRSTLMSGETDDE